MISIALGKRVLLEHRAVALALVRWIPGSEAVVVVAFSVVGKSMLTMSV